MNRGLHCLVLLCFYVCLFLPPPAHADLLHASHDAAHGLTCESCHRYSLHGNQWPPDFPPGPTEAEDNLTNFICLRCHDGTVDAPDEISAPAMAMHSAFSIQGNHQDWTTSCTDCHDPHFQSQLSFLSSPDFFLATGFVTDVNTTTAPGNTIITYTADLSGSWPAADWPAKTAAGRGLILIPDTNQPNLNYEIIAADLDTITIQGTAHPSTGSSFGIFYGQLLRNQIRTPGGNLRQVSFFEPKNSLSNATGTPIPGGFVDSSNSLEPTGICQVCHTVTSHFRNDGTLAFTGVHAGLNSTGCMDCHAHTDGFKPTYADHTTRITPTASCQDCHAGEAIKDIHARNSCATCHDLPGYLPLGGRLSGDLTGKTAPYTCQDCHATDHTMLTPHNNLATADACGICHRYMNYSPATELNYIEDIHKNSPVSTDGCRTCHTSTRAEVTATITIGEGASGSTVDCTNCHVSGHPSVVFTGGTTGSWLHNNNVLYPGSNCSECHFPAYNDTHSELANNPSANDCATCHTTAETFFTVHGNNCLTCHLSGRSEVITTIVVNAGNSARVDCTSCHNDHDPVVDHNHRVTTNLATDCSGCHDIADQGAIDSLHTTCQTCHSYAGDKIDPAMVRAVINAGKGPDGSAQNCEACHTTDHALAHDNAHADEKRCRRCHFDNVVYEHTYRRGIVCTACHESTVQAVLDTIGTGKLGIEPVFCNSCHNDPMVTESGIVTAHHATAASKNGDCGQCHSIGRGSDGPNQAPCLTCHGAEKWFDPQRPSVNGHAQGPALTVVNDTRICFSCHLVGSQGYSPDPSGLPVDDPAYAGTPVVRPMHAMPASVPLRLADYSISDETEARNYPGAFTLNLLFHENNALGLSTKPSYSTNKSEVPEFYSRPKVPYATVPVSLDGVTYQVLSFDTSGGGGPVAGAGDIQTTITPPAAITAGGQWSVDGGDWLDSDAIAGGLPAGQYALNPRQYRLGAKMVAGWATPKEAVVTVTDGALTTAEMPYGSCPSDIAMTVEHLSGNGVSVDWTSLSQTEKFGTSDWFHQNIQWELDAGGASGFELSREPDNTALLHKTAATTAGTYTFTIRATGSDCPGNNGEITLQVTVETTVTAHPAPPQTAISDQAIDDIEVTTRSSTGLYRSNLVRITGDIYGVMDIESGTTNRYLYTYAIAENGAVTPIDSLLLGTGMNYAGTLISSADGVVTAVFVENRPGSSYNNMIKTVGIAGDGSISGELAAHEFGSSLGPLDTRIIALGGDRYAMVYRYRGGLFSTFLTTFSISPDGTRIEVIDNWEFTGSIQANLSVLPLDISRVKDDVFVISYNGVRPQPTSSRYDGRLSTVSIDQDGIISKSFLDTLILADEYVEGSYLATLSDSTVAVLYNGVNKAGILQTFHIDANGAITPTPISTAKVEPWGWVSGFDRISDEVFAIHSCDDSLTGGAVLRTFSILADGRIDPAPHDMQSFPPANFVTAGKEGDIIQVSGTIYAYTFNGTQTTSGGGIKTLCFYDPSSQDKDQDGICDQADQCPDDSGNDQDQDGICGNADNCPKAANPNQTDSDQDGVGDACDTCPGVNGSDADGDGLCDLVDPCPLDPANDGDADGICADRDNCPVNSNADQTDTDNDGTGDVCDADQALSWSAIQFGTTNWDWAEAIALDSDDNSYVIGHTYNASFYPGGGKGKEDVFLIKRNWQGEQVWIKQFGSPLNDYGNDISIDPAGNLYITGSTQGDFFGPQEGGWDTFVAKYDNHGNLIWGRQFKTVNAGVTNSAIAADAHGNVYVVGSNNNDPITDAGGVYCAFLTKYDTTGNRLWTQKMNTSALDYGHNVTVDHDGNIIVLGTTGGTLYGHNPGYYGTEDDVFIAKYSPDGTVLWGRQPGSMLDDNGAALAVDGENNIVVGIGTKAAFFPPSMGSGAVLIKYDANGTMLWGRQYDSAVSGSAGRVAIDRYDDIYMVGSSNGSMAITKIGRNGEPVWLQPIASGTVGLDILVDDSLRILVPGFTTLLLGDTAYGSYDGFLLSMTQCCTDLEDDGVADSVDNCPYTSNPDQADTDGDSIGDACDFCPDDPGNDLDGDLLCAGVDSCPDDRFNDADNDGICGDVDNCPEIYNPGQENTNGNWIGDACEADISSNHPSFQTTVGSILDQTVTVTNNGGLDLVIGTITTQLYYPYSLLADNCSGQTLIPTATCTIDVRLEATVGGPMSTGIDIPSNDPDSPSYHVYLLGGASGGPMLYAYIANYGSDSVSVVTVSNRTVAKTVPVGDGPYSAVPSPDGSHVYVANYLANTVSIIQTSDHTVIGSPIAVGTNPKSIAISPDGSRVYVMNATSADLSVIQTSDNTVIGTVAVGFGPVDLTVSPDSSTIYVASAGNFVSVINAADLSVTTPIAATAANGITISHDGTTLYVMHGNTVESYDSATFQQTAIIPVGTTPNAMAITPDDLTGYVTNYTTYTVSVIDLTLNTVIKTIPVGAHPTSIAGTPDAALLFVSNSNKYYNSVSIVQTRDNTVISTVKVGVNPYNFGKSISGGF